MGDFQQTASSLSVLEAEDGKDDWGDVGECPALCTLPVSAVSSGKSGGDPPKDLSTWDSVAGCVSSKAARWGVAWRKEQWNGRTPKKDNILKDIEINPKPYMSYLNCLKKKYLFVFS